MTHLGIYIKGPHTILSQQQLGDVTRCKAAKKGREHSISMAGWTDSHDLQTLYTVH